MYHSEYQDGVCWIGLNKLSLSIIRQCKIRNQLEDNNPNSSMIKQLTRLKKQWVFNCRRMEEKFRRRRNRIIKKMWIPLLKVSQNKLGKKKLSSKNGRESQSKSISKNKSLTLEHCQIQLLESSIIDHVLRLMAIAVLSKEVCALVISWKLITFSRTHSTTNRNAIKHIHLHLTMGRGLNLIYRIDGKELKDNWPRI